MMYPLVNRFAKKKGKKLPIILGCIVFSAAEIVICFSDMLPGNRLYVPENLYGRGRHLSGRSFPAVYQ